MKFEKLEQFIAEPFINRAKWLREAEVEDLATVMLRHPEFATAVRETVSQEGRTNLAKSKILKYEESFERLTQIEFEPADFEVKSFDD